MSTILKVSNHISIELPDDYNKNNHPLPGLTEWVTALRSKDFKQGTGSLKKDDCYCCLGVLSHLQERLKEEVDGESGIISFIDGPGGSLCYLSFHNPVEKYIGQTGLIAIKTPPACCSGARFRQGEIRHNSLRSAFGVYSVFPLPSAALRIGIE